MGGSSSDDSSSEEGEEGNIDDVMIDNRSAG